MHGSEQDLLKFNCAVAGASGDYMPTEDDLDLIAATLLGVSAILCYSETPSMAVGLILTCATGKDDNIVAKRIDNAALNAIVTGAMSMLATEDHKVIMGYTLHALDQPGLKGAHPTRQQLLDWWRARGLAYIPGKTKADLN